MESEELNLITMKHLSLFLWSTGKNLVSEPPNETEEANERRISPTGWEWHDRLIQWNISHYA